MAKEYPQTEEGLQKLLVHLAAARQAGDDAAVGKALLKLAYLVKWVRSDNHEPPFERSHTLALEALEVYRRIDDPAGQVSALIAAAPFELGPEQTGQLDEAELLAAGLADDLLSARVLAARARHLGLVDRDRAKVVALQALELFRSVGNASGQIGIMFSLAILPGERSEKRAFATEGGRLCRDEGDFERGSKLLYLAGMNSEPSELGDLEPLNLEILKLAQDAGDRFAERDLYKNLAEISEAKADVEAAARYIRWHAELEESDGLTPLERWEHNVAMTKMLIAMGKRSGSQETVKMFEEDLAQLKKQRPKRGS